MADQINIEIIEVNPINFKIIDDTPIQITIAGETGVSGHEVELRQGTTNIQWRYVGQIDWNDLIAVADLVGPAGPEGEQGLPGVDGTDGQNGAQGVPGVAGADGTDGAPGANGTDGREVQLQVNATHVQWRYEGDVSWTDLITLSTLKGDTGDTGSQGIQGIPGADGVDGQDGAPGVDGTDGAPGEQGEPGPQGPQGIPGEGVDILEWDGATEYTPGDFVYYNQNIYIALQTGEDYEPSNSEDYWLLISSGLMTPIFEGEDIVGAQLPYSLVLNDFALYLRQHGDLNHSIRWGWGSHGVDGPVLNGFTAVGIATGDANAAADQLVATFSIDGAYAWNPTDESLQPLAFNSQLDGKMDVIGGNYVPLVAVNEQVEVEYDHTSSFRQRIVDTEFQTETYQTPVLIAQTYTEEDKTISASVDSTSAKIGYVADSGQNQTSIEAGNSVRISAMDSSGSTALNISGAGAELNGEALATQPYVDAHAADYNKVIALAMVL